MPIWDPVATSSATPGGEKETPMPSETYQTGRLTAFFYSFVLWSSAHHTTKGYLVAWLFLALLLALFCSLLGSLTLIVKSLILE